jgi:hypothetical protein
VRSAALVFPSVARHLLIVFWCRHTLTSRNRHHRLRRRRPIRPHRNHHSNRHHRSSLDRTNRRRFDNRGDLNHPITPNHRKPRVGHMIHLGRYGRCTRPFPKKRRKNAPTVRRIYLHSRQHHLHPHQFCIREQSRQRFGRPREAIEKPASARQRHKCMIVLTYDGYCGPGPFPPRITICTAISAASIRRSGLLQQWQQSTPIDLDKFVILTRCWKIGKRSI